LPAFGLERIGAHIEDIAHVELFDIRFEPDLVGELVRFQPDIIAINVKTTMHARANYEVARRIRSVLPSATLVAGGLHASAVPEETLDIVDYVVCGDGELAFRQLVSGDDIEGISGLVYRRDGVVYRNRATHRDPDLDMLRPPARHLRKPGYVYAAAGAIRMDLMETSRGCTHACTFCSPANVYPHQYRQHSPEYVLEEVQRMAANGVEFCMVTDDHFGGDLERVDRICDLVIASGIKMVFFTFIRPFTGHTDVKRKMVRAGFAMVTYGAESPRRAQLKRYRKGFPNSDPEEFLRTVNREWHEAGAAYVGNSYVFGDVDESAADLARFGVYARKLGASFIEPLYSQPYPGTPYREEIRQRGLLTDRDWPDYTEGRLLVKHPELDEGQMKDLRVKTWLDFFSPRRAAMQLRLPQRLYRNVGVPRERVMRFLRGAEKMMFGCLLEDRFYGDRYGEMVDTYFRSTIRSFEPEEMDYSENIGDSLEMLGMGWMQKRFRGKELVVNIVEGKEVLASFVTRFERDGDIRAFATAGPYAPEGRFLSFAIPLRALRRRMAGTTRRDGLAANVEIHLHNLLWWVRYRRIATRARTAVPPGSTEGAGSATAAGRTDRTGAGSRAL